MWDYGNYAVGRTLTSAWIETAESGDARNLTEVALSRVRGLKRVEFIAPHGATKSHSHECVD